jgi:hypothetical protein
VTLLLPLADVVEERKDRRITEERRGAERVKAGKQA